MSAGFSEAAESREVEVINPTATTLAAIAAYLTCRMRRPREFPRAADKITESISDVGASWAEAGVVSVIKR
jgi:hypothetical protein